MFGMGFTEILLIAVVAILFLGPDKLPSAMLEVAKFFKTVKQTVGSVKESLEDEINATNLKQEALAYKEEFLKVSNSLPKATDIQKSINEEITTIFKEEEPLKKIEKIQEKGEENV